MGYFPLCVDLKGKRVLLIGNGAQIADKAERLRPFGVELIHCEDLLPAMLAEDIALVVVGDTEREKAARISGLCSSRRIPVNVVDMPQLCSFFFPALITRDDVTVSVSTGGKAPGAAGYLAWRISAQMPEDTGEIVDWLHALRQALYETYPRETARQLLREAMVRAFEKTQ